ncbi:substrate-binding domain-containing protein [Dethiothermospora halolimnae]|uniref:substrate-binding domain-containing protein n=1 Tax=Dethiothermospora halolimnae TaxID=3114390 RepID=UPI003CCBB55B
MKKVLSVLIILSLIMGLVVGCSGDEGDQSSSIVLATTTSTRDSGLLDEILPSFEEETGIEVKVVAIGTGAALQKGRDGDADVLLVHAKPSEEEFVKEGHGLYRKDVMYNDFVIVGPKNDPVNIKENAKSDVLKGYKLIEENKATFVSRGDDSGTHKKEKALWKEAGIEPKGDFYVSTGSGMGDTLKVASEKQGYAMTDRATYLNLKDELDLEILLEKDEKLFNQYGVIPVNPDKNENINNKGAEEFINWLLSKDTQEKIGEYGKEKFGMPLFTPNGK